MVLQFLWLCVLLFISRNFAGEYSKIEKPKHYQERDCVMLQQKTKT